MGFGEKKKYFFGVFRAKASFMSYDAFYEKLEEITIVAFIMKYPVAAPTAKTRASRTTGVRGINFLASSNKYQIANNTETSPPYARVAAMINKHF